MTRSKPPAPLTEAALGLLPAGLMPLYAFPSYVRALLHVKKAAALANAEAGVLSRALTWAITKACDELVHEPYAEHFPVSLLLGGGQIAVNLNINEQLAHRATAHAGATVDAKAVNASQSTADVCATAARLAAWHEAQANLGSLAQLHTAFEDRRQAFSGITTRARTCLRDAMPTPLSSSFEAYGHGLARRRDGLAMAAEGLLAVNLGGTVVGGGEGAPPLYRQRVIPILAEITELPLRRRDSLYDAAQNCDDLAATAAAVGLLAELVLKIASDIRLLSSGPEGGFGELTTPSLMQGSSFFPAKINPTLEETVMQAAMQALGHEHAARLAVSRGELNLNVFEGLAVINLLLAFQALTPSLQSWGARGVPYLQANRERCESLAKQTKES